MTMPRKYTPYIPQGKSEIMDQLGSMMLSSPKFEDDSGYFPGKNIDTVFYQLNEGLRLIRKQLGVLLAQLQLRVALDAPEQRGERAPVGASLYVEE